MERLSLSRIVYLVSDDIMSVFKDYFEAKQTLKEKWKQLENLKPTLPTGMSQEMSAVYDELMVVRYICRLMV